VPANPALKTRIISLLLGAAVFCLPLFSLGTPEAEAGGYPVLLCTGVSCNSPSFQNIGGTNSSFNGATSVGTPGYVRITSNTTSTSLGRGKVYSWNSGSGKTFTGFQFLYTSGSATRYRPRWGIGGSVLGTIVPTASYDLSNSIGSQTVAGQSTGLSTSTVHVQFVCIQSGGCTGLAGEQANFFDPIVYVSDNTAPAALTVTTTATNSATYTPLTEAYTRSLSQSNGACLQNTGTNDPTCADGGSPRVVTVNGSKMVGTSGGLLGNIWAPITATDSQSGIFGLTLKVNDTTVGDSYPDCTAANYSTRFATSPNWLGGADAPRNLVPCPTSASGVIGTAGAPVPDVGGWVQGVNTLTANAQDYFYLSTPNNSPTSTWSVLLDTVAPTTSPTGSCSGTAGSNGWWKSSVNCTISASDTNASASPNSTAVAGVSNYSDAYTWYRSSGATCTDSVSPCTSSSAPSYTVSSEGTTTVYAKARDFVRNQGATYDSGQVKIDTVAPGITKNSWVSDDTRVTGTVSFSQTVSDSTSKPKQALFQIQKSGAGSWTTLDTENFTASSTDETFSVPVDTTTLDTGATYLARVVATDEAGNETTTATTTFIPDSAGPSVTAFAPTTASPTNGTTIDYSITFSGTPTGFTASDITLSGTSGGNGVWTISAPSGSGAGPYTFSASNTLAVDGTVIATIGSNTVTDSVGNPGPGSSVAASTVTIDRTAPTITSFAPTTSSPTNGTSVAYSVTFSEAITGFASTDITLSGTSGTSGSWTRSTPVNTTGNTWTFNVSNASAISGTVIATIGSGTVSDSASNTGPASSSAASSVTIDRTAPTVSSFASTTSSPTNSTTINYSVTFSEAITGFTSADVTISGTSGSSGTWTKGTPTNTTGNTWTFSLSNASAINGTVIATIGSATVTDSASNTGPASSSAAAAVTIDRTAPTVSSFASTTSSPTNGTSVAYSVTFSETITGFASGDITLSGTSGSSGSWTISTPTNTAGNIWTFSASNASAIDGTVIATIGTNAVTDSASNTGPASPSAAASVTIDRTNPGVSSFAPTTSSPTNGTSVAYSVTFSETITGFTSGDITLSGTSGSSGSWTISAPTNTGGNTWTFTASNASAADGTVIATIGANTVSDSATNTGPASSSAAASVTIDRTKPVVSSFASTTSSPTNGTIIDYSVTFSETVSGFASGDITLSGTSGSQGSWTVSTPTNTGGNTWTFSASNTSAADGTVIATIGSDTVSDSTSNTGPASPSAAAAVTIDRTKPAVESFAALSSSPTNGTTIEYSVTFSESVSGFASGDISLSGTSGSSGSWTVSTPTNTTGNTWTFSASNVLAIDGTVIATIGSNTVTDSAGNTGPASPSAAAAVTIDRTAPGISSFEPTTSSPSNGTSVAYSVTFSESVTGFSAADVAVSGTSGSQGSWTVSSPSGSGAGPYTFNVSNASAADGTVIATINATTVSDPAGNTGPASSLAASSVTIDRTKPSVSSFEATTSSPTNGTSVAYSVAFSEAITGFSSGDISLSGTSGSQGSWTVSSPSGSGAGPYTFNVSNASAGDGTVIATISSDSVDDPAGNTGPATSEAAGSVTIDRTAPGAPTLSSNPSDPAASSSAEFTWTGAEGGGTFECKLDGGSYSSCSSPKSYSSLAQGPQTFYVRQIDSAGNTGSPATYSWTVDTVAPAAPTITGSPDDPSGSNSAEFAWTGAEGGGTFECRLDGGSYSACSSPETYTSLSGGSHTFYVRQIDAAGNTSPDDTYTWSIDTGAPGAPTFTTKPTDPSAVTTSVYFSWTGAEAGGTYECKFEGDYVGNEPQEWGECTSPLEATELDPPLFGTNTFYVRQIDESNNIGTAASWTWTIDTGGPAAPTIDTKPSDPSASTSAAFTWTGAESGGTFQCRIDNGSWETCTSGKSYSGLDQGPHTFDVRQVDELNNNGTPASYSWVVDTEAPQAPFIETKPSNPSNSTSATFEWLAMESGGTFQCKLDGGSYETCTEPKTYTGLSETSHTFYVRQVDAAGNLGTAASWTWSIDTTGPGAPTITSAPATATASTGYSISWTGAQPGGSFKCRIYEPASGWSSWVTCTSPVTGTVASDGTYSFQVKQLDDLNNESPASETTWAVDTEAPSGTPTLTSTPAENTLSSSASFSFSETGEATPGRDFQCKLNNGSWEVCGSVGTNTGTKSYTGLTPGYNSFQVRRRDWVANAGPATTSYVWCGDPLDSDSDGIGNMCDDSINAVFGSSPNISDGALDSRPGNRTGSSSITVFTPKPLDSSGQAINTTWNLSGTSAALLRTDNSGVCTAPFGQSETVQNCTLASGLQVSTNSGQSFSTLGTSPTTLLANQNNDSSARAGRQVSLDYRQPVSWNDQAGTYARSVTYSIATSP
jgi:hypothetical protein